MRRLIVAPIAILSTSCAMRPWTPSVSVAYWSQDVPDATPTPVPLPAQAMARWQIPDGNPWAPYAKYTLLASLDGSSGVADLPDVRKLEVVQRAEAAAASVAAAGLPDDTLWVVDLRGAASVAFGAALTQRARDPVAAVPTFNNWPEEDALVPAEETLAAMVTMYPRLAPAGPSRPVFLLDAWRLAYRQDEPAPGTFDNRYALTPADLPSAEALQKNGIRRVVYLVEDLDDAESEEDDVHESARAWQEAGIPLYLVDLGWVIDHGAQAAWHEATSLAPRRMLVEERVTILSNPVFYSRARGGFGGVIIHGGGSGGGVRGGSFGGARGGG